MHPTTVVYESVDARACSDRALVLHSLDIPYEIVRVEGHSAVIVPAEFAERAKYELWQYDQENRPPRVRDRAVIERYHDPIPGALAYVAVLCVVGWLAGQSAFGLDWLAAGRVEGTSIRDGEWWRTLTALTLHSGVGHLLGNIGFGVLFGGLAARLVGGGVAWLCIVIAAGLGNLLNTVLLESTHRSIGASTAVFAALGLLGGFVWRAKLMAQDRWPWRLGPVVGAIALLAYTGTGDAETDIGAHLSGFVCGFAAGMALTFLTPHLAGRGRQAACGAGAAALILVAWLTAFAAWLPTR